MSNLARSIVAMALPVAVAWPAVAQAPELAMLDTLERGAWELRIRPDGGSRRICVRTGRELIQIRHAQQGCDRFVIEDNSANVTVQYTCRGHGYGRTSIRRESGRLLQIRSQGIHDGEPFSLEAEGRRIGAC